MPALNFQTQWADAVWIGAHHANGQFAAVGHEIPKRTTIRRPGRVQVGNMLYLYTGQRTPQCRKLGEALCLAVTQVWVPADALELGLPLRLGPQWLSVSQSERLARLDTAGLWGLAELIAFFAKSYGLPFDGELISW